MAISLSQQKVNSIIANLIVALCTFIALSLCDRHNLNQITLIGISLYAWIIGSWYKITKNIMNVYLFFVILSFFFYLGQPILYILNIDIFSVMTVNTSPFDITSINETLIFLLKSMALFHFGASFSISYSKRRNFKKVSPKAIARIGFLFLIVSIIPQLIFTFDSLKTTLEVGYGNIFASDFILGTGFNGGIPRFLADFFKASLLLLILGNKGNKSKLRFWTIFAVVVTLIMIISGQRGTNTLFLLSIVLLYNYAVEPFPPKKVFKFILIVIISIIALSIISSVRNLGISNYSISELATTLKGKNFVIEILGEMGFTLIACTTVIVYCPSVIPFNNGLTYFNSVFQLIPNLFWAVNPAANGGVDQVFKSLLLNKSGMGSSVFIEGYYNFGQYALFLVPIFGYLIGKLYFDTVNSSRDGDYLKLYVCLYMSFIVLWFVRSETLIFWRNYGYYAILPVILIKIYSSLTEKMSFHTLKTAELNTRLNKELM